MINGIQHPILPECRKFVPGAVGGSEAVAEAGSADASKNAQPR
jgi:hypothetical protein